MVGVPIPRLTTIPSWNSLATRRAIVCSSSLSAILCSFSTVFVAANPVYVYRWGCNTLRINVSQLHHLVHLGNSHLGSSRHSGIKVSGGTLINEVTPAVGLMSTDKGKVRFQSM